MIEKKAVTSVPINHQIASRWSGRAYNPERPVEPEKIRALLEAARWAPSCFGDEPWRYIVCDKRGNRQSWQKAFACLSEGNQSWAVNAPLLILVCASSVFTGNGRPNRWGQYDTGAASMNLCIQATELDLMVHQMGGYDADLARDSFNIPEQFISMAMMAIGYQLPEQELTEDMKERELADRHRSDLNSLFFDGEWDNSLSFQ